MHEDRCDHGYIADTCAECRAAPPAALASWFDRFMAEHKDGQRAGWLHRRTEVTAELAQLESYARRSRAQDERVGELTSELTVLGSLIDQDDVRVRSERLEEIKRFAADPANCEAGWDQGPGAPPLVKKLGDRPETADETLQRMRSNPWRDADGGPLAGHTSYRIQESGQGLISRAHTALEGLESQLTRDGAQKLAEQLLADSYGWPGVTVKRSKDEAAEAAELVLALSNPHYLSAFRSVLRYPMEFTPAGPGSRY